MNENPFKPVIPACFFSWNLPILSRRFPIEVFGDDRKIGFSFRHYLAILLVLSGKNVSVGKARQFLEYKHKSEVNKAELTNMNSTLKEKISNFLMSEENVVFALLFGSTVTGHANQMSDLDIGIYLKNKIDLTEIGRIISEIEKITHYKIDLVELNDLYNKDPLLAFEIISSSELLFSKNSEVFIHFKKRAILHFLDTERLRETFRNNMRKRIAAGKFGRFNYA